ncbi:unnamed protein product [Adineta ricciae]|uniref:CAP-Gly domain-containing protein n=1 Tax=Adineta ricciae TaxID=249248 RepID=A0A813QEB5_ADIRI|nr:unnamed protein product [Adineta ricciae]
MSASATTERKSFLPLRLRSTTVAGSSNIPTATRSITPVALFMPSSVENEKLSFSVGERVLVNGLKIGTLRYAGTVKFASGLFYGVELDEPEGKHDGQVNDFRYFQCKANHGVFVPYDKVILAPRERTLSTYRTNSRLKPPTVTRTMTVLTSTHTKFERNTIKPPSLHAQLPDIIPSPTPVTQPITIIRPIIDPIVTDDHDIMTPTEQPRLIGRPILQAQPMAIDEPVEPIEADFTDSVSLILHQLQQEEKPSFRYPRGSLTISEGSTNDDDDADTTDDCDSESIAESSVSERMQIIGRALSIEGSSKCVQTDLSFGINDNTFTVINNLSDSNVNKPVIDRPKMTTLNKRLSIPSSVPIVKKDSGRKASVTSLNTSTASTRRTSLIPPKKESPSMTRQNSINSIVSISSQSKFNQSLSSTTSIEDNYTETTFNARKSSKITFKSSSTSIAKVSNSTNLDSDTNPNLTQQLFTQKTILRLLEDNKDHMKKQYQQLLHKFDILCVLSQYYLSQNDEIRQYYDRELAKVRKANDQLKISIEILQTSHKDKLVTLEKQHRHETDLLKERHGKQTTEYQQNLDEASNKNMELDTCCKSLQEQVDRFVDEMEKSEHADPLSRRVEILEKDRASLQTVLEIRNQELTQLRSKINEQVLQREDQLALQKRIDMAENRNQDLVCLLRNWQLNEKAVTVERDQLKEQLAQLERDYRQLTFENETLIYRLRDRPFCATHTDSTNLNLTAPIRPMRDRTHSLSSLMANTSKTTCRSRSLSLERI